MCVICAFPLVRLLMLQVLTKSGRDIQYMEDKIGRVLKDLTSCLWIDVCCMCVVCVCGMCGCGVVCVCGFQVPSFSVGCHRSSLQIGIAAAPSCDT